MKLWSWINQFSWMKLLLSRNALMPLTPWELHEAGMKQEMEHREGWANLYRGHPGNPPQVRGFVHPTERVARAVAHLHGEDCIATVKVEWGE
jgi:hypothetical protein